MRIPAQDRKAFGRGGRVRGCPVTMAGCLDFPGFGRIMSGGDATPLIRSETRSFPFETTELENNGISLGYLGLMAFF